MIGITRKFGSGVAVVFAASACVVAPASAQDEVILATPKSNWLLNFADYGCLLQRDFATAHGTVGIRFEKSSLSDFTGLMLFSTELGAGRGEIALRMGRDGGDLPLAISGSNRLERPYRGVDLTTELSLEDRADATPADSILAVNVFDMPVRLQTGDLGPAFDAFNLCVDDLLAGWGLDVELARTSVEPASRANFQFWARDIIRRAPQRALPRSGRVSIAVRIVIGTDGKPSNCLQDASERYSDLGEYTCQAIMEQAEYEPAKDREGNPVPAMDSMDVVYYR